MPLFQHDCEDCRFVATLNGADIYLGCDDSVIVRHSDDGPDYQAMPLAMARRIPDYKLACALVDASAA